MKYTNSLLIFQFQTALFLSASKVTLLIKEKEKDMRKKVQFTCIGLLILAGSIAFAKTVPTLVVATGPEGSNNGEFFKRLKGLCSDVAHVREVKPTKYDNLKMLVPHTFKIPKIKNGPIDLSFISLDRLIQYHDNEYKTKGPKEDVKILLPIHKEKIILLTNKYKKTPFNKIKKMGSVRRTFATSKLLKKHLNATYKAKLPFRDTKRALFSLNNKKIDGLLLIYEEKADWAADLSKFSVASIPYNDKLRSIYDQELIYIKGINDRATSALSSQNLLVTRNYLVKDLQKLRFDYKNCLKDLKNLKKTGLLQNLRARNKNLSVNIEDVYPEFFYKKIPDGY